MSLALTRSCAYSFIWDVHESKIGDEIEPIDHMNDVDSVVYKLPDQGAFTDPKHFALLVKYMVVNLSRVNEVKHNCLPTIVYSEECRCCTQCYH